jgi:hypothetical protein
MTILAFMQNQWFKDPPRMRKLFEKHYQGRRHEFVRTFLFFGCRSGQRLRQAFGDDVCDYHIIWEEASPEIGGRSSAAFPADLQHMAGCIELHRPQIILTFGKIAQGGLAQALPLVTPPCMVEVITGPHPAARHATVIRELEQMALKLAAVRRERAA